MSNSIKPLSKIDETINVFCFGKLPIIVSIPTEESNVTLSPISRFRVKLSSLPKEILLFSKFSFSPTNSLFLKIFSFENSLLLYPLSKIPFVLSVLTITASPELLRIKSF